MAFDLEKITERLDDLKEKDFPIFKTKLFKIVSYGLCGIILILMFIPLFLDNSNLKFQVEQDVSKALGANFTINSNVEIALLPSITISARNILLQNYDRGDKTYNIYAKEAKIELSLLKSLIGKVDIKGITLNKMVLERYYSAQPPSIRDNDLTTAVAKVIKNRQPRKRKRSGGSSLISKLEIDNLNPDNFGKKGTISLLVNNAKAILYNKSSDERTNKKEILNIFGEIEIGKKAIKAQGEFINENIVNHARLVAKFNSKKGKDASLLELSSSIFHLKVTGDYLSDNKGILESDFNGNVEAEILELKPFYHHYVGSNHAVYDKLKPGNNPIKISGHVNSIAGEINVEDLVVNSSMLSGKGAIDMNLSLKTPIIDIILDLDNFDLDTIWSSNRVKIEKEPLAKGVAKRPLDDRLETIETSKKTASLISDQYMGALDLTAEIKIKKANYLGGELKDVDLYLTTTKRGEILVLPVIFKVPGKGMVRINGAINQEAKSPKFIGTIDAKGENLQEVLKWVKFESQNLKFDHLKRYMLYSDILLTPNIVSLDNLYLNLDNDKSEFLGSIRLDNSDIVTQITNKFRISSFNADDYFLISGQNVYLSPGSLLNKTLWLNNIQSNNRLELKFDKLTYKGEDFFDQSIKLEFGQGYLAMKDLTLKSENTDLSASLTIDLSDQDPEFSMNIAANEFHYASLKNTEIFGAKDKGTEINAADQFFALPSLEGFGGRISLKLKNLILDDMKIEDVEIKGNIKNGNIKNSIINCTLYGGELAYRGLLGLKYNKTLNGNLVFNNVNLKPFLSDLVQLKNIDGIANIAANITSSANNRKDFVKRLSSKIKFQAGKPVINGYGLDTLVQKMFYLRTYRQDLLDPESVIFNPDSKTVLNTASGTINIFEGRDNKFKIDFAGTALNGIIHGTTDIIDNKLDALTNIIFITGNRQNKISIHIATSLRGKFDNLSHATNLDQVKQRLGLLKVTPKTAPVQPDKTPKPANDNKQKLGNSDQDLLREIEAVMQDPDAYQRAKQQNR